MKWRFFFSVTSLLLLFPLCNVFAQEKPQALLEGPEDIIYTGDVALLKLTVWPLDQPETLPFESLRGQKIGRSLIVISVKPPEVSGNNEEAVVTYIYGVFTGEGELPESLKIGDQKLELLKRSIDVDGQVDNIQSLNIFSWRPHRERKWSVWLVVVLIAGSIVFYIVLQKRRNNRRLKERKAQEDFWISKLKTADSRREIEELYAKRAVWSQILKTPPKSLTGFYDAIENIQYKKEWSSEEFERISRAVENIRRATLT